MPYFRRPKDHEHPYAQISNDMLDDPELSFKAKGLLSYLLAQSDEWEVYQSQLAELGPDGKTAVRSGLEELMEAGYIERKTLRNDDGTFKGYEYIVFESRAVFQDAEIGKPEIGDSDIQESHPNNTNGQQHENKQNDNHTAHAREGGGSLSEKKKNQVEELTRRGVGESAACHLVQNFDWTDIFYQIRHYEHLKQNGRCPESSGWIVSAVKDDYDLPMPVRKAAS